MQYDLAQDISSRSGFNADIVQKWLKTRNYITLRDIPKYFFNDLWRFSKDQTNQ